MTVQSAAAASGTPIAQVSPLTAISVPSNPTLSASGTGSTLPAATYYVKLTGVYSITYNGRTWSQETTASAEVSQTTTSGQNLVVTSPSWATGIVKTNVYVASSTGAEMYQGQITSSGGTLTISAPLLTSTNSPATTNFPSGNLNPPTTATSFQIIYQAPAVSTNVTAPSSTCYIKEIVATNTNNTSQWLSLCIVPSGGVASVNNAYAFYQTVVGANGNDAKLVSGINKMMLPGSTIQVLQQNGNMITVDISGQEVQ